MRNIVPLLLVLLPGLGAMAAEEEGQGGVVRRFALVVGANYGGLDRVRLQFAESDAQAVSKVLGELGGVVGKDRLLVTDPNGEKLTDAIRAMRQMVSAAQRPRVRRELVFYFSGHADESGLLLGTERFGFGQLREAIQTIPAEVRLVILDSCASGAFTRLKGGAKRQPFLVDQSSQVEGYAVLTSSSATEAAQESDRVGGSIFTHYLVSGLRGAADINQDGQVTLGESYQYAFHETLARTENTRGGAQHPNYDFQLAGRGDLVLTDLRATSAALEIGPEIQGRIFIRNVRGQLVAEVNKPGGNPILIGLEPGSYKLTVELVGQRRQGTVEVPTGKPTPLVAAALPLITAEAVTLRGTEPQPAQPAFQVQPFNFFVVPGVDSNPKIDGRVVNHFSLGFLGKADTLDGVEVAAIGAIRTGPVSFAMLSGVMNVNLGPASGILGAGVLNYSHHQVSGAQLSGAVNVARSLRGFQGSVANVTYEDLHGVQGAMANYAGDLRGVQLGMANVLGGEMRGAQLGMANVVLRHGSGAQIGMANVFVGDLEGSQVGMVNVLVGEQKGAQVGMVNIASKAKGLMIGMVNIADEMSGTPIGLVQIFGNGFYALDVWSSDAFWSNVALKMGTHRLYSLIGISARPENRLERYGLLLGLGGRWERGRRWYELDLTNSAVYGADLDLEESSNLTQVRAKIGWQIASHFALFAGLSLDLEVTPAGKPRIPGRLVFFESTEQGSNFRLSPGFLAGLQI